MLSVGLATGPGFALWPGLSFVVCTGRRLRRLPGRLLCVGARRKRFAVLHEHAALRIRNLDAALLEQIDNAPVELALYRPARAVAALDLAGERHCGAVHRIDAPEAEVGQDAVLELVIVAHRRADLLQ